MTERQNTLDEIRVNKAELIDKLKANLTKHIDDYKVAMIGYHIDTKEKMGLAHTKALLEENIPSELFYLPKPQSHASEYELAIEMLEMSVDTQFTISKQEFQRFVRDEWSWSNDFRNMSAVYSAKVAGAAR